MTKFFNLVAGAIITCFAVTAHAQNTADANTLLNEGMKCEEAGRIADAESYYVQSAEAGNPSGWILAGNLYAPAVSQTPDAKKAAEYLEKGILYDQRAAPLLGLTYYLGDATTQPNYDKALVYLKKASEMGMAMANSLVGTIYLMGGYGVAPDPDQVLLWIMPSAEAGDTKAMYNYGLLLINGTQSLQPDPAEGIEWIKKSAQAGNNDAQSYLNANGLDR